MEIISENVKKIIKIKKGLFGYKKIEVLKNINYTIKQGEIIAIMGEEGSGKSTLINVLSGKTNVSEGRVYINGDNNKKLQDISEVITDFNSRKFSENESVYNNLVMYGNKNKINNFDIEKKIVDLRDVLQIEKIINKKINELDEISKIKVSIAVSMMNSPLVLYFDNALMGLDAITKTIVLKLLKRINKEFKTTIVVASVDLMDIEKICKRVSVIKNGEIVVDGDFENVKKEYWKEKIVSVTLKKTFNLPKGDFEIIESSDYFLRVKIDFNKCDFASFITQFEINNIVDINISENTCSIK